MTRIRSEGKTIQHSNICRRGISQLTKYRNAKNSINSSSPKSSKEARRGTCVLVRPDYSLLSQNSTTIIRNIPNLNSITYRISFTIIFITSTNNKSALIINSLVLERKTSNFSSTTPDTRHLFHFHQLISQCRLFTGKTSSSLKTILIVTHQ